MGCGSRRIAWTLALTGLIGAWCSKLRQKIDDEQASLRDDGLPIVSEGIDDNANRVIVGVSQPVTPDLEAKIAERLGPAISTTYVGSPIQATDYLNDSAPWNGGDSITPIENNAIACTSGFGVHAGPYHFMLTEGHCGGPYNWYNSPWPFGVVYTRYIGAEFPPLYNGTSPSGPGDIDAQLLATIPANSSGLDLG